MNDMPHNKKEQRKKLLQALSFFSQIAVTMAACVLIGVGMGKLLDDLFGTGPTLLLIFSFLGVGAAIKSLFDMGKNE